MGISFLLLGMIHCGWLSSEDDNDEDDELGKVTVV